MNEIKDYVVYPDNIEIYTPPTMPAKQDKFYKNLVYVASAVVSKVCIRMGSKIEKINMDGLKPPYIVLSNHTQFVDFLVSFRALRKYNFNNIATLDGFVGMAKIMEKLMPEAGLVTFEGAGHYSFLERRDQFLRVLASFMKI